MDFVDDFVAGTGRRAGGAPTGDGRRWRERDRFDRRRTNIQLGVRRGGAIEVARAAIRHRSRLPVDRLIADGQSEATRANLGGGGGIAGSSGTRTALSEPRLEILDDVGRLRHPAHVIALFDAKDGHRSAPGGVGQFLKELGVGEDIAQFNLNAEALRRAADPMAERAGLEVVEGKAFHRIVIPLL